MGGSAPRRDCHLPVETTSFVDRRTELAAGRELLSRARLVTLTGPGGVGKTRLALRMAARLERAFPDGVRFVPLAGLHDPALVPLAAADALSLRDHSEQPPLDALVEQVRDRRLLLVVDNCEHLLPACAQLAAALLHGTPGVRVLATSRHRLGLTEEHLLEVRPLQVPDPDGDLTAADGYPALALFADRAAAVVPGFRLTSANRAAVARLCSRLDGLPLAIELAAVRMRVLDVDQLLERLDDRYRLLTTGSPAVLPRHQTLRAAVTWSHELCTPEEQLVWARLSVLAGTFDLETAEAVGADETEGGCGGGRGATGTGLRDEAPQGARDGGTGGVCRAAGDECRGGHPGAGGEGAGCVDGAGVGGEGGRSAPDGAGARRPGRAAPPRTRAAGDECRCGHPGAGAEGAGCVDGAGVGGEGGRSAPDGAGARRPGRAAPPRTRAAGDECRCGHPGAGAEGAGCVDGAGVGGEGGRSAPDGAGARRPGRAAPPRTRTAGPLIRAQDVLEAVAGLVDKSVLCREAGPDGVRYRLLDTLRHYGLERLRERPGEERAARRRQRDWMQERATACERAWFGPGQSAIVARLRADRDNLRAALDFSLTAPGEVLAGLRLAGTLWFHWHACGVPREGRYWLDRALDASPAPTRERARALWASGLLAGCPEDLTRGLRRAEQARDLARRLGDAAEAAHAEYVVGVIRLFSDDLSTALDHFRTSVARGRAPGQHLSMVGLDHVELACALCFLGEADEAIQVCEETRRLCTEHGEKWVLSYALRILALAHTVKGDWWDAERHALEALRLKLVVHDVLGIGLTLDLLARIAAERGDHDRAAVLLGGADRAWADVDRNRFGSAALNSTRTSSEARVREAVGGAAFHLAHERGAALSLHDIVGYALGEHEKGHGYEQDQDPEHRPGHEYVRAQPPSQPTRATHTLPDPTTRAPAPRPAHGVRLTPRETEVAELVAQGLANQQIADRLVIARRTAEGHVERILSKLGFSNRSQIATWVTAQR